MADADKKDELEGTEAPFVSHLIELRDRLIRAVIAIACAFAVLAFWPGPSGLYDLLAAPLVAHLPKGATLIATNVISPILVPLKITLMAAFMVALPVVLYQVWAFVAPGLYSHEKRLVLPLVVSSTLLFVGGVAFCYFLVIPGMSKFIQAFAPSTITAAPDIEQYFGFVLTLFLVFGIAFEVPIAVIVLARMGIVTIAQLKQVRGYFVVGAFVVSAVVTPPDVISQLALAIPMCILYEVGIVAAQLFMKHTRTASMISTTTMPMPTISSGSRIVAAPIARRCTSADICTDARCSISGSCPVCSPSRANIDSNPGKRFLAASADAKGAPSRTCARASSASLRIARLPSVSAAACKAFRIGTPAPASIASVLPKRAAL